MYEHAVGRSDKELRDHKAWVAEEKLCKEQECGSYIMNSKKVKKNSFSKDSYYANAEINAKPSKQSRALRV